MSAMRLAIVCSGQAGQRREMLDGILGSPDARELCSVAAELLGREPAGWWRGLGDEAIFANKNAQFAIALSQLAMWQRIRSVIPEPVMIAGYSLGELLAYHVAGALDARETLRLVQERADAMDAASGGLPASGGCMLLRRGKTSAAAEQELARSALDVAIIRSPGEIVLAGPADEIDRFLAGGEAADPNLIRLPVTTPSHSHYLSRAALSFRTTLEQSALTAPSIPVLAGISGLRVRTRTEAVETLSRQIDTVIRWDRCMEALKEAGITTVIELGPGNDLAKLVESRHPQISARSVDDFRDWKSVSVWLNQKKQLIR